LFPKLQILPLPHSASPRQSWVSPIAQLATQAEVVPLLLPLPPMAPAGAGFGVRQQTVPLPQLAALEHEVTVVVPMGQLIASAAQLKVLAPAPMPMPPCAPGTVQQVGVGFWQKVPVVPQGTLPLVTGLMGALVPSGLVLPLAPALPLAFVLMDTGPPLPLPLDPPQALTTQATNTAEIDTPDQSRNTFILVLPLDERRLFPERKTVREHGDAPFVSRLVGARFCVGVKGAEWSLLAQWPPSSWRKATPFLKQLSDS